MTGARHVELVACAAPLASRVGEFAAAFVRAGWTPSVTLSVNARPWVDESDAEGLGQQLKQSRAPGEPRKASRPDAVVVVPATFNTLNKLRLGISDTPALGVLNDALGAGVPLLAVPMINERLAGHPAWRATVRELQDSGVTFMDPTTGNPGSLEPLKSGTGDEVAAQFDPNYLIRWVESLTGISHT